jgi:glycosyltransferase involved in cell wall biosynthesis
MNVNSISIMTSVAQPSISVMIPVYEPKPFLLATLSSVLNQYDDFPDGVMEVVLVDDGSPSVDVARLISTVEKADYIRVVRYEENVGLARNWNRAIELARGELVHILHQDDLVLPGFYKRLHTALVSHPEVGMAFCRHAIINAEDATERVSRRERWTSGVLHHWLARIAVRVRLQCPSAIVRKSTYDKVGLFREDLIHALDWEMWVRIACHFPVWYETKMLALFRRHSQNETARLATLGAHEPDVLKTIEVFSQYLPVTQRHKLVSAAYEYFARSRLKQARKLMKIKAYERAAALLGHVAFAVDKLPSSWKRNSLSRRLSKLRNITLPL